MSMKLTAGYLEAIARDLGKLKELQIEVESFVCCGHKVMIRWTNGEPQVVGITVGEFSGPQYRADGGRAEAVERTSGSATLRGGVR